MKQIDISLQLGLGGCREQLFSRTTMPRYRKANTMLAHGKTTHALRYTAGQGQPQGPNNHSTATNATEHNKHCMKADSWPRHKPNA